MDKADKNNFPSEQTGHRRVKALMAKGCFIE
jgi:hypothetical protein